MRTILGVLSLLVVVAVVGLLAKKQLGAHTGTRLPAAATSAPTGNLSGGTNVPQQSQQLQQQIKQTVEATMQQARPEPEDK